ncbi:hypothetical protein GGR56DRAFT_697767 [Xylariaceae sp. FL0804]|nr:hypothetical protein GGR56DRAFT_697767 [Xylariaceae sp. FL0804]
MSASGYGPGQTDADESAKALDKGAAAAMPHTDFGDDISAAATKQQGAAGEKTTGAGSAFDSSGAIGKQFTSGGALGGAAQKVGGPLDKDGSIGKQFTEQGSIGGTVKNMLGGQK